MRPAERIAERWAAERSVLGVVTSPARVAAFAKEADWLLANGADAGRLEREAVVMASHPSWFSLVTHMESRPAQAAAGGAGPGGERRATPEQVAALRARLAGRGSGL